MKRTYTLALDVEGPDSTDLDMLDGIVENVVEWSTAREAIDTGIFGACDHLNIDVVSLRVDDVVDLARHQLDDEGHDDDCVARCLRNDCDYDHGCEVCSDDEEDAQEEADERQRVNRDATSGPVA